MNPLKSQLVIRDFELFMSNGVHEIPQSVFERDNRAAGEYRLVRGQQEDTLMSLKGFPSVNLGHAVIDLQTGNIASAEGLTEEHSCKMRVAT